MALGPPTGGSPSQGPDRATGYGWAVFAISFGLLISDYMARQVLNAVFPLLKAEWSLSDARLGLLSGVVAVMVGLLTLPLSLVADRWGRVRSLTLMAVLWSLATLLCAIASNFEEMLFGRALVGLGEAAYGSVGIAVVISVFPSRLRSTLTGAFMAGGLFGQVLGVALGAQIAASHGWRVAFASIGVFGLALGVLYPLVVRETRIAALAEVGRGTAKVAGWQSLRPLYASRSIRLAYAASGLQMFAVGALPAWLPSYFNRYYNLPVDRAGRLAGIFLLICGTGMILCGMLSDRLARRRPERKISLAIAYCLGTAACLSLAILAPPGFVQLILLGLAMFLVAGTAGTGGAIVANLTPLTIHGSAFAAMTLANNLLGFAPGPIIIGRLADSNGGPLGAYSTERVMPAAPLFKLPDAVSLEDAAASTMRGLSATYWLKKADPRLKAGDTILLHAAAGGVGLLAIQIAKQIGLRVIGTVSTEEKAAAARAYGCDEIIFYRREDVAARVKELTGGEGVQTVFDSVGTPEPADRDADRRRGQGDDANSRGQARQTIPLLHHPIRSDRW